HLSELHRRALHRPEHRHDLLGGLQLTAREGLLGGLVSARDVGGARAELLYGLAGPERGYRRGATHTRGRGLVVLARSHVMHAGARDQTARSTREPGTMSSEPSSQRPQALVPPS